MYTQGCQPPTSLCGEIDREGMTDDVIEQFSYDLEMKAHKQNRNDKRTEIERFDWFIERTDKRAWLFIG